MRNKRALQIPLTCAALTFLTVAACRKNATWSDPSPHKSAFVTANGVRLNYLDWGGSRPTLILIHGIGDNPHKFDDVAPAFTDRFRVIAYARRGHGDSEAKEPYDGATLTEDLRGLMDALGIKKAHLAGWSMGGNEITAMAGIHPERVDRLVYLDGGYDWADGTEMFKTMPPVFEPTTKTTTSLNEYRRFMHAAFLPGVVEPSRYEAYIRDQVVVQPDGSVKHKMSDAVWLAITNATAMSHRDYSKVHSPALAIYAETFVDTRNGDPALRAQVVSWEQQYVAPFRTASIERIRRELSSVHIMNVPGTHNDFHFTSREQVVAAMRRFLGESKVSTLQSAVVGPLVELSQPNAVGNCNTGSNAFGSWSTDNAEEPFVAVNPLRPNNIVAAWMQGPGQAIVAAVSLDGGNTWRRVPIPVTTCSGGRYPWTGDVWLSFSPNGDLYAIAGGIINKTFSDRRAVIVKSADGGLHWSAAQVVPGSDTVDAPPDHPSLTADPRDARFVYGIWDGSPTASSGATVFTRTTDGGATWETARAIVQTAEHGWIQFSQIFALPSGTLVDLYQSTESPPDKPPTSTRLQLVRSTNHGQTWSSPINAVAMTPVRAPNGMTRVNDPKTGKFVQDPTNPSFAVNGRNDNLYAVWEDGRFSNSQYNDIAFSMSADGGATWSIPIRVNRAPLNIPVTNRQAFLPSIAVARNGTIAVSYYDFRFNNANPGLATDCWLVQCHPSPTGAPSDAACWGSEVRLTNKSFNMEAVVPVAPFGIFIGDYFGLASAGDDFVAAFAQPDEQKITSIFARRVGPARIPTRHDGRQGRGNHP